MKTKVAVIFGGKSTEHEISIISAVQAMNNMDEDKYEIIPLYLTKDNAFYTGEALRKMDNFRNIKTLLPKCQRVILVNEEFKNYVVRYPSKLFGKNVISEIDVALPVVHGTNVEDGTLQGYLRTLNIPFAGCDVFASGLGMDKYAMKIMLKEAGFPVLDCCRFNAHDFQEPENVVATIEKKFAYPVIVKPVNLGSSIGISRADDRDGLDKALETAFTFADKVLVEPAITELKEINCAVLGDSDEAVASECEEPLNAHDILSFQDKYMSGGAKSGGSKGMQSLQRKIPADIPPETKKEIQEMAVKAFQYLDCNGVSRIDFMIDKATGKIYFNEINTIPGSLSFYLWEPVGIKYKELLDKLIKLALKRQRRENDIVYSFDSNVLAQAGSFGAKGCKGSKL
ncbi:MAG: D-alanine--D-alanine ligase [Alphaproteobacteria bacterium]|nr:D-alanine--D-alanine ligase [Alphaproteobacteria bacterium]